MIPKPFDQITRDDINLLVTNQVKENRLIEYKLQLPGPTDKDKKEFLADASSFANAAGGDLLYGVDEERDADGKTTGVSVSVPGLSGINVDQEIRRFESMMQAGIGPRIASVRIRPVEGFASGPVLLVRIPKSYSAPHMVTFQEHSRFYSRNNAGKYPLVEPEELFGCFASGPVLLVRFWTSAASPLRFWTSAASPHPEELFGSTHPAPEVWIYSIQKRLILFQFWPADLPR
jgi:hypothetical protein